MMFTIWNDRPVLHEVSAIPRLPMNPARGRLSAQTMDDYSDAHISLNEIIDMLALPEPFLSSLSAALSRPCPAEERPKKTETVNMTPIQQARLRGMR